MLAKSLVCAQKIKGSKGYGQDTDIERQMKSLSHGLSPRIFMSTSKEWG